MSFPTYAHYKDSGVEWLGEVPAHWEVVPLKHVISKIESGTSVNAIDIPASGDELGVLKTSCVYRGEFDPSENKAIVAEEYGRAACPVTVGTLIVSRMNTPDLVGAAGVVRKTEEHLFLPDRLWQVHFRDANPSFVHFWCNTNSYRAQVEMACAGASSSMQNLAQDQFRSFFLLKPALVEQDQITAFLTRETTKLDALITEQRTLIDLLKEKRQAVISHAVTKGLDAGVAMKDSGVEWLGEVPAHWDVRPVKSIASIGNGATPNRDRPDYWSDGNYPWLSSTVVNQDIVTEATEFVTQVALDECHLPKIIPPAILVGITGQGKTRGMVAILGFEATINQHIACVKPIDEACVGFVRRYFDMAYERMRFESDGAGSTKGAITCEQIANMKMPLPPIAEQKNIGDYIDREMNAIDALTAEAQTTIALLQERRSALISAAVTGKIDVRGTAFAP